MRGDVLNDRQLPPLAADHPAVGARCIVCGQRLAAGARVAMVEREPADAGEGRKALSGRAYTAVAGLVHERHVVPVPGPACWARDGGW